MKIRIALVVSLLALAGVSGDYAFAASSSAGRKMGLSEQQRIDLAKTGAPIKSAAELDVYLSTKGVGATPFSRLTAAGRARFLQSLTFNDNGLSGFNYKILEAELTPTEIYQLLSLFGFQHLTSRFAGAVVRTPLDAAIMESSGAGASGGGAATPYLLPAGGGTDHEGYWCSGRATCSLSSGNICTSNC